MFENEINNYNTKMAYLMILFTALKKIMMGIFGLQQDMVELVNL